MVLIEVRSFFKNFFLSVCHSYYCLNLSEKNSYVLIFAWTRVSRVFGFDTFCNDSLAYCRTSASFQYDQEFQHKPKILFILTNKTKTREKISRIYKSKTIITEILNCLALVQP